MGSRPSRQNHMHKMENFCLAHERSVLAGKIELYIFSFFLIIFNAEHGCGIYLFVYLLIFQAREREMLQKLEEKDGESLQMNKTHSSLQEEVDNKTKKLKKVEIS